MKAVRTEVEMFVLGRRSMAEKTSILFGRKFLLMCDLVDVTNF